MASICYLFSVPLTQSIFRLLILNMRIAFLGMGIMGRPMAANLVKAGHEVTVWNRTPGKDVAGAKTASTPADGVQEKDVVWMCGSDSKAVEQVLLGQNREAQGLQKGTAGVDSS